MKLTIDQATEHDRDALVAFAEGFQREAFGIYPAIPHPESDVLQETFRRRLENGTGVVARDGGDIVGCLLGFGPIEDFRPGHTGVYAPLGSCLATGRDTDRIFTAMLIEFGNLPALARVQIAAFTCWPHHPALNASLVQNGFGLRCADAIARIRDLPAFSPVPGLEMKEVPVGDAVSLREVKQDLARHLASGPAWQEEFQFTPEFIAWKSEQRRSVHIAAYDGEHAVGFIEATFEGENYLTVHPTMRNICGAGVLPEYRNRGIMRALLGALADRYRADGITVLGVDYETQNPNARGFWESIFTPYTWSWERHVDRPWGPL